LTEARLNTPLVLVVDDEVLVANMIADQLGDLGYMVAGPVYTLKEGQRVASTAPINGALVDINLGREGLSSSIAGILISRNIPFRFVSGYNEVPDKRFRHVPILTKPFTISSLAQAVEQMLASATC
jgi:CheY-like chemotaxis protein